VNFGDFTSTWPISACFGFDRGLPLDRYYIEKFLARHAGDVRGRVLEIGDDSYSRQFGGANIGVQDILHVHAGNPIATLVGDLTDPAVVADGMFDCMILTQTLHLIYDFHLALKRIHAALRPGGVVLLTVPGITQIDRGEWGSTWYWAFTSQAMRRLFGDVFEGGEVEVVNQGNVFAATAFLQGLAVEEVDTAKLDVTDDAYQVIISVRARKAGAA
jgi:SAM-dependent methyltransferase